jgi:hypothetical protein
VFFLCLFGLVLALIITVAIGLVRWRKSSRRWIGPPLLCLAFILSFRVSQRVGVLVDDWRFKRNLAKYTRIVNSLRDGTVACSPTLSPVEIKDGSTHVSDIWAACCPDGSAIVELPGASGGALFHVSYLFKNDPGSNACLNQAVQMEQQRNPHQRHIVGNWYHVTD